MDLAALRLSYTKDGLEESSAHSDPIEQFRVWFNEALEAGITEPNAMTLATVSSGGAPSARTVLLKQFDATGFVFYTNYNSRKGRDLESNPQAALLSFWPELQRQVRIEGTASRVSRQETERYFSSRPEGHQLGAWASPQSEVVTGREELERQFQQQEVERAGQVIPAPPHWGGYRVRPAAIEFWQGRLNRLHDRLQYTFEADRWLRRRLAP